MTKRADLSLEASADGELDAIWPLLRSVTGLDFRLYQRAKVARQVARRMALLKIASISRYSRFLRKNMAEAIALTENVCSDATAFFRDPECFQALRKQVLPKLRLVRHGGGPVRIWVPGCSTGEEVYSLAMLLLEGLEERGNRAKIQIFGTDISERAIAHARAGIFSEAAVADVSARRLKRFFTKTVNGYQVRRSVREICVFARQDLAEDPPFSRLDLVSCRNVLTSMCVDLRKRTLSVFHYALKPGGFLFLGKSESALACPPGFEVQSRKHALFLRTPGARKRDRQAPPAPLAERNRLARLERELAASRQYIQALIRRHQDTQEQMSAASEELQATNEDLVCTNEELQSAKEELQTSNEELSTLNQELQVLTSDLTNLLVGVDIPVLVLDGELRIRRFTPMAEKLLSLIPPDIGRPFSQLALPLELTDWDELIAEVTGRGRSVEREVRHRNGRWYSLRIRPYKTEDGRTDGLIAVFVDIDLIKRALDEVHESRREIHALAASLLTAQEDERRRVSRELHDELCQQLASLAFDIGGLAAATPDGAGTRLRSFQGRAVRAAEEARHLAYQLHPSTLDDLGLAVSLKALCEELPQPAGTAVSFTAINLPDSVPGEIASCIYRVSQEALWNIAKHSRAMHASVTLAGREDSLVLSAEDDGIGFDPRIVKGRGGLGMVSMEERARIVNGRLSVESQPGRGTRITLVVALPGNA
jgi:chemotaxis methyl-accepting protein methylase/PAS domain-containing protein